MNLNLFKSKLQILLKNTNDNPNNFIDSFFSSYDLLIRTNAKIPPYNNNILFTSVNYPKLLLSNGMKLSKITGNEEKMIIGLNNSLHMYWKLVQLNSIICPGAGISNIITDTGKDKIFYKQDFLLINDFNKFIDIIYKRIIQHFNQITGIHNWINTTSGTFISQSWKGIIVT